MTTVEQEHLRKRFIELTEQNIDLEQRVEELMAAVEHVNNAGVLKIRELEARIREIETSAAQKRVRELEIQIAANEDQLDRWSWQIEPLKARNAELEAVREAAELLRLWLTTDGKVFELGQLPHRDGRAALLEEFTDLLAALIEALAAAEPAPMKDVQPLPQQAQERIKWQR